MRGHAAIFGTSRPAPVRQLALPPYDLSDSGGEVHTTPPPELVIPRGRDRMFMRADFGGVTLNLDRWKASALPYLRGANTTPLACLLSPMLVMYPRYWQDAYLTESSERFLTHFVVALDGWNMPENGFTLTPSVLCAWLAYLRSWDFYTVLWRGQPMPNDPLLVAALQAGLVDWYIFGQEVNRRIDPLNYQAWLAYQVDLVDGQIPIGTHLTSDWPLGYPQDTYLTDWSPFDGHVHLMWQANQAESAGTQAAKFYYARKRVNLGWIGENTYGPGAPNSNCYAFEVQAAAQLDPRNWTVPRPDAATPYGTCSESYGVLRGKQLLYATRDDARVRPVAGVGNGGNREQDGTPF